MIPSTEEENTHIVNKSFVIYAKKHLVIMIKNAMKFKFTVITLENIGALHIIFRSSHQRCSVKKVFLKM